VSNQTTGTAHLPVLSAEDRELLDFLATLTDLSPAATEPVLFARYGNTTRVWQRINGLLAYPPAFAYAPDTIGRLTRLRDQRRRGRGR
jgi:hypothetical protein